MKTYHPAGFLIAAFFLLITSGICYPQSIRHYNVDSGLSGNSIKSIIQDKEGRIWFATQDGLNVFNGKSFKSYGCSYIPDNKQDISTLNIMFILQHRDGHRIWAATQSSTLYLFDPDTESFTALDLPAEDGPAPNFCRHLSYGPDGRLWIASDTGVFIYDDRNSSFKQYSSSNSSLPEGPIKIIYCDSKGVIWIGSEKSLCKYSPATDGFIPVKVISRNGSQSYRSHIIAIEEDPSGTLWCSSWSNGLAILHRDSNTLEFMAPVNNGSPGSGFRVRHIMYDSSGCLFLCSNLGFFRYDILNSTIKQIALSTRQPIDNIYTCFRDKEGGIWIGSYFQGAYYISPTARQIECYTPDNVHAHLHGSAISSFCEDSGGNIWIASENGGLSLFDPVGKKFIPIPYYIPDDNLHTLCTDSTGKKLYIGTYSKGVRRIDLGTGRTDTWSRASGADIPDDYIFSIFRSSDGFIYAGTTSGCSRFDPETGKFFRIHELDNSFIYDIVEDSLGYVWFAGYYDGLHRFSRTDGTWKTYRHDSDDPGSIAHDKIVSLHIDDRKRLWICTEGGGACRYDYESDNFHRLNLHWPDSSGITLSVIYGILTDSDGRMWLSSNNGIWCCMANGEILRHLTGEDGLQSNQYNFGATFRSSTGLLYFGGINGFNVINPENLKKNSVKPDVTAHVTIAGGRHPEHDGHTVIPRNINSFSVNFECLSYTAPDKNLFAYRIDRQQEWITTYESSVTFINFPYGTHRIQVKARNGENLWSDEIILEITNLPPLLKSRGAKIIYLLTATSILFLILFVAARRMKEQEKARAKEAEIKREQEEYDEKIKFFTLIAHEIKTPVTLIKAPLEMVLKNGHSPEDRRNLDIIEKNTGRLLNLVNQLLDFRKISSGGYRISMKEADPCKLVNSVIDRFSKDTLNGITILASLPDKPVRCKLDPEAYIKIVSNLMTNAIRHTKTFVKVCLETGDEDGQRLLRLSVRDDGPGIPEEEAERIFRTFYQISSGSTSRMPGVGLGLSLVRLLAEKHSGKVYVDKSYREGCSMCVDIPYLPAGTTPQGENKPAQESPCPEDSGRLKILVVEDTPDMVEFIAGILRERHTVFTAGNGREALGFLKNTEADIIVSDISMPVMDGLDMLKAIRKDDLLCHIPVILLTVENSTETKIRGLEYGADAYMEKPFSPEHLIATVQNLISRREALRQHYASEPLEHVNGSIVSSRDKAWLEKVTSLILANLNETEIPINYLSDEMNVSRSSFQRKIKGLTGMTPVEFIRLVRLKKAADLLSEGNWRINEVCFLTGFNKPSYFSSCFRKQFGILPKDFVRKVSEDAKENGNGTQRNGRA